MFCRGGSAESTDDDASDVTGALASASLGSAGFGTKRFTNAIRSLICDSTFVSRSICSVVDVFSSEVDPEGVIEEGVLRASVFIMSRRFVRYPG